MGTRTHFNYLGVTHFLPLLLPRCLYGSSLCLTHSCLSSPWRKRQLQFLLEGRGRRAGLSPEELRDNGKLLGESLSRALFNYPSRDCSAESPEVSFVNDGQVVWETATTHEMLLLQPICLPTANMALLRCWVTYLTPTKHQPVPGALDSPQKLEGKMSDTVAKYIWSLEQPPYWWLNLHKNDRRFIINTNKE